MQETTAAVKPRKRDFEPYFTYREQCILRQWVERYWMPFLTPAEFKVLSVVISRTVAWGKLWETIPLRHFIEGAALKPREKAGEGLLTARAFRGTGMSANTVRAAIRGLCEHGFLCTKPHRDTTRYSVNWQDMGAATDPVLMRFDMDAEAAELQSELVSIRRRTRAEGGSTFEPLSNIQPHSLRSLSTSTIVEVSGAPGAPSLGEAQEQIMAEPVFPTRRARKAEAAPQSVNTAPPVTDWRDLAPRVSGRAANDEASRDVISTVRQRVRAAPPVIPAAPVDAAPLDELVQTTLETSERSRRAAALSGRDTPQKIYTLWSDAFRRATRKRACALKGKWSGQIRNTVLTLTLPDPRMRWGTVAEWVAERYGYAVSLAVPFMLKTPEKRADILHNAPSFSLFLAFADHFSTAMAADLYGEGITPGARDAANAAQRDHERWMNRRGEATVRTHDGLSGKDMTVDELMDRAVQAATDDPEIARLMAERAALQAIAAATRGDGAARQARADAEVRRVRNRARVQEAAPDRERLAQEHGIRIYSDNPDDYYNEE